MYNTMRTSVLCYLVMLTLTKIVHSRNTMSLPDNFTEQETAQADMATRRPRDPDGASGESEDALGDAFHLVAKGMQRLQDTLRLHERKSTTTQRQMQRQLEEQAHLIRYMRHSMDERMRRVENMLGEQAEEQSSPSAKEDGEAAGEGQPSINHLKIRLVRLEAIVEQVLKQQGLENLAEQLTDPSSEPHTLKMGPSAGRLHNYTTVAAFTTLQPPTGSTIRTTVTQVALTDQDRERQRVALRIEEVRARRVRARAAPSHLGERLCRAAFDGKVEDVRRLLDMGTDVNYTDRHGGSPLKSAFYLYGKGSCNPNVVSLLIARGADVNVIDMNGWSVLHYAAFYEPSGQGVALLLDAGADVNARDEDGATPLQWAAINNNEVIVRALLAAGANKSLRGWSGHEKDKAPFDVTQSDAIRDLLRL